MRNLFAIVLLLGICIAVPARAALQVDITQGATGAMPIAIVPFATPAAGSALPVDLAKVIDADLRGTGLFAPLARKDMLATPARAADVRYQNWRAVKVDDLVVGSVTPTGSAGYRIDFEILGVYRQQSLGSYQISVDSDELRVAAHTIANRIYKQFTGQKGYFLSRIAYVVSGTHNGHKRYRLVVSDYDGHNAHTVVTSRDPVMSPDWSPTGTKLAYVAFNVKRGRSIVRVQNLSTGRVKDISARPGINGAPAWSPNGQKLALTLSYQGDPDIYTYDMSSGTLKQLTHSSAIDTEPVWSPDGGTIAFTSDRGGKAQIYQMNADGGNVRRLTYSGQSNQRASYSPQGDKMVMVQQSENGYRIAVLNLKTNNVRIVSKGPLDESPSFSPNGQTIIYARQGNPEQLATVSVDGQVKTRLHQSGGVREPAWSPSSF